MESDVKFGVTYASAQQTLGMLEFAPFVERIGFDSVWNNDHLVWRRPLFDSLTVLAAFAATSQCIQIGCAVLILPLRNPALLAKTVTTLDILSNGRLLFGLGVGGEYPKEFEVCGIPVSERGRRADEAIEVMKRLWTAESVSYEGRYVRFTDITMEPPPLQRPHPPLLIGGRAEPTLRRAGRHGDIFFPYLVTPEGFATRLAKVRDYAVQFGRDPASIGAAHQLHIYAGKTKEQARETAGTSLLASYSLGLDATAVLDKFCAYGTPADCAERIQQFVDVGARHLVFELLCPPEEIIDQCEVLARDVVPLVRSSCGVAR